MIRRSWTCCLVTWKLQSCAMRLQIKNRNWPRAFKFNSLRYELIRNRIQSSSTQCSRATMPKCAIFLLWAAELNLITDWSSPTEQSPLFHTCAFHPTYKGVRICIHMQHLSSLFFSRQKFWRKSLTSRHFLPRGRLMHYLTCRWPLWFSRRTSLEKAH